MLERGRYGVEWTKRPEGHEPSALGRLVAVVIALALVSLAWTVASRVKARITEAKDAELPPARPTAVPSRPAASGDSDSSEKPFSPSPATGSSKRPPKVRNLLMRLEVAERQRDVEMAISTIEQLRALPGSPAADLDDALARRLGVLNLRRLFSLRCAQWVTVATVKKGQSAARLAFEHGSTLASLAKLNGGSVDAIRPGQKLYVLNHPRFSLVVRRRTRTADLQLNGKFFRRYDLLGAKVADGVYAVTLPIRSFWERTGLDFRAADRAELELLMPKDAAVIVSEM